MAFTLKPKLFESDLSNYSEIRRGLSKAMRDITPTKRELASVDPATRQGLINQLNNWRTAGQATKAAGANTTEAGVGRVLNMAAKSGYYSAAEKVKIATAAIKVKTMDPDRARWEIWEALNGAGRLHGQDFYKAKYYYDAGDFDATLADDGVLSSALDGGLFVNDPKQLEAAIMERLTRQYGSVDFDDPAKQEFLQTELADQVASYYNDVLNVAKMING